MTTFGYLVVRILALLAFGGFIAFVASEKGYSGGVWFWLGMLCNFVALVAASRLPKKNSIDTRTGGAVESKVRALLDFNDIRKKALHVTQSLHKGILR